MSRCVQAWDLATSQCQHTLTVHADKVQALAWNPAEPSCILSGGFDAQACISDLRAPGDAVASWKCSADVESLAWSHHQPTHFVVSAESGEVVCFDTRKGPGGPAVFTLAAHNKATTSVVFNPAVPDLLVTGSIDKTVRRLLSRSLFCSICSHESVHAMYIVNALLIGTACVA